METHEDHSIPLYEPSESAGPRYTKAERRARKKPYYERWHGHAFRQAGEPEKYTCPRDNWYYQYDTDVLELARLFSVWFGKGELKRPIYESSLKRVYELLAMYRWLDPNDKKLKWKLRKDWPKRLIACGVDPVTFQIKDINRWSRAWEYMKCEFRCPVELIEQDILNGKPAPPYKPFTWSQSLRAQTGRHYNEYGPRPRKGNELIARSWVTQIGSKVGLGRTETDAERRNRARNAGERKMDMRAIPLTETP